MNAKRFSTIVPVTLLFLAGSAAACQCRLPTLQQSTVEANVVLVATVSEFVPLQQVTVKPTEVLKGRAPKSLTIPTAQSDCDYFLPPVSPNVGDSYLLFLASSNGRLVASRCHASGPIAEKAAELRQLRRQFKRILERPPGR